jgi:hypothetical protein
MLTFDLPMGGISYYGCDKLVILRRASDECKLQPQGSSRRLLRRDEWIPC